MHYPLVFSASAILIASFIPSTFAVPAGPKRAVQYCTQDDILGPFSSYLPFQADVTQFCSTLIGITNVDTTVATTTPISTAFSTTVITGTTTQTVTSYTKTVTITTTSAVYELKRRNDVELAARAAVTDVLKPVYREIQARQAAVGSSTNFDASAISEGLVSACSCLYIAPALNYITATASTSTRNEGVVGRDAVTDTVTAIASDATTTTVLFNSTSNILPVSASSASSSTVSMSSLSISSLMSSSPSSSSSVLLSSSSSSRTGLYAPSSVSSSTSSMPPSTNSTSASSSTLSSTTVGPVPTGCPFINGTYFSSTDPCQSYEYVCGVNYPDEDFYNLEEMYESIEMCAADVCTHANSGKTTPCLGVSWNSIDGNCRELMSVANPIYDPSSLAALSVRSNAPSCQKNVSSSSSSVSSTTSAPNSMNVSTSSATTNMPMSMNMTTTWSMNTSTTWSYPTSTGSWPHQNHTHSWNSTRPTNNSTWSRWLTAGYSSGTGATSGSPVPTSNNTCPITTAVSTVTKLATLYSGNYTFTTTETQYVNASPNNASTITQVSLVTVVITDLTTTTTDSTTTVVNTHRAVTDTTSTSVEIDLALSTTTETSMTTETDVSTATDSSTTTVTDVSVTTDLDLLSTTDIFTLTETDTTTTTTTTDVTEIDYETMTTTTTASTETDVLTFTTTDSTETTTTTSFVSTELDVATLTTTDSSITTTISFILTESDVATLTTTDSSTTTTTTTVSTETDTATFPTTATGNPVGGRSGRSWWIF